MTTSHPADAPPGQEGADRAVLAIGGIAWVASARSPFEALVGPLLGSVDRCPEVGPANGSGRSSNGASPSSTREPPVTRQDP